MMKKKTDNTQTVASSEYTEDYYVNSCQGYEEFQASRGQVLPRRLRLPFEAAGITPDCVVLDIGCGRGEVVYHAAKAGARAHGLDYAVAAVKIASENLKTLSADYPGSISLHIGDARRLPLDANSVDIVFMLDVVEHLYPHELSAAFDEVRRVLKPGGRLVVHTMPNLWYYRFVYPLFRAAQQARGVSLPKNPRDRWEHIHTHVNEQTPLALRSALRRAGFATRVWLESTQDYDNYNVSGLMNRAMKFFTAVYPFRLFFCNDIFAVSTKAEKA